MICKEEGRDTRYVGETGSSLGERAGEYWQQFTSGEEGSHILSHRDDLHPEELRQMKFELIKRCRSALERQVSETINVKMKTLEGSKILNSKIEYI